MATRMQVNCLNQDELIYEVKIRGIATETVDQMRHALAVALKLEKSGDSFKFPAYSFSVEEDVAAIGAKLTELEPLVSAFNNSSTVSGFLKLQSRLSHVLNRIDHIEDVCAERPNLVARTLSMLDMLHKKAHDFENLLSVPPQLSFLEQGLGPSSYSSSVVSSNKPSNVPTPPSANLTPSNVKPIPPHKWDLKFSGDKELSLSAFLKRVEKLRNTRHVSKDVLLESGIDLFSGRAYQFYLAYRNQVTSWDEFITLINEEYHSSNYNKKLFEEIRNRTQGPNESIGIYLAVMAGYFNRLTCSVSKGTKLKILMRNIAPFYQTQLALVEVTSVAQLRDLGRRLEARKEAVENFAPPRRTNV